MIDNPVTIAETFMNWLPSQINATQGTDLFYMQVPGNAPPACWWVISSGGSPVQKLPTGETIRQYFLMVYYRSNKGADVERQLSILEESLNTSDCLQLQGYEIVSVEASQFPADNDLDSEDRRVGMLQATIEVYKK
jgi:hypothetical protein